MASMCVFPPRLWMAELRMAFLYLSRDAELIRKKKDWQPKTAAAIFVGLCQERDFAAPGVFCLVCHDGRGVRLTGFMKKKRQTVSLQI